MKSGLSSWAIILILVVGLSVLVTQRLLSSPSSNEKNTVEPDQVLQNPLIKIDVRKNVFPHNAVFPQRTEIRNSAMTTNPKVGSPPLSGAIVDKSVQSIIPMKPNAGPPERPKLLNTIGLLPAATLKCDNQTKCLSPALQLKKTYKVYYCKHIGYGVRFFFLVKEGLLLHPQIVLVSSPSEADAIVYLPTSSEWSKSECGRPEWYHKLIVLDEGDGPGLFHPPNAKKDWFLLYFKRSYVKRENGDFNGYLNYVHRPNVFPMTYTIAEAYVRPKYLPLDRRDTQILCTLRGHGGDPVRQRVREWTAQYAKARGVTKYRTGEVNSDSRTVVSKGYFEQMFNAQIIVTSNPSGWEGDFRLMEAFASGALVFVDRMFVPRPYPLEDWKHVVYYDNKNKTELFDRLDAIRADKARMTTIAANGYLHAMKFHRAANLIDYVFRTLHSKELAAASHVDIGAEYLYTGYQLRQLSQDAADALKKASGKGRGGIRL